MNVGHRDLFLKPELVGKTFDAVFPASRVGPRCRAGAATSGAKAKAAKRVWIDLDCDAFDPAFFPAVSAAPAVRAAPPLFFRLLDAVWSDKVCGLSVSEFDPGRDVRDTSLNLLGWLLEHLLLKRYGG